MNWQKNPSHDPATCGCDECEERKAAAKQTPTPLARVNTPCEVFKEDKETFICDADGIPVCKFVPGTQAEHIKTALNAHEELVKSASAVLKDLRGWIGCVARSNGFNHEATRRAESRLHALKQALAKAGVKP